MKKLAVVGTCLSCLILTGCASGVTSREELFSNNQSQTKEKECYSYDTQARNMARNAPSSAALGVVGGLFPPLMILTALASGASAAIDQETLPIKCGLTIDDATKEAWTLSFYEDATAIWQQKANPITIIASPLYKHERCVIQKLKIVNRTNSASFEEHLEICKNEDGLPILIASGFNENNIDAKYLSKKTESNPTSSHQVR